MRRRSRDDQPAPMTLGNAWRAKVRLIVWRNSCRHPAEPDVAARRNAMAPIYPCPSRLRGSEARRAAVPTWGLLSPGSGDKRSAKETIGGR